jgi:hypothetical protein
LQQFVNDLLRKRKLNEPDRRIEKGAVTNMSDKVAGYLHPAYAASFCDWGRPVLLPQSGGWLLERKIPATSERDAIGCYPIFACRNRDRLDVDIAGLDHSLVAVSLVTDPFADFDAEMLRHTFRDRCVPFKEHFVADLSASRDTAVSKHHRREAHRALRHFRVEVCPCPPNFLDEWVRLYQTLIERHGITGLQCFSRSIFARQFEVPGFTLFRAEIDGTAVGMTIWYEQGDVAYFHLSACNATGYKWGGASYALMWTAWEWFAPRVRWLALGAASGQTGQDDGLSWFKRGWATATRTAYFCGRVLDRKRYETLARHGVRTDYFPAYRAHEFAQVPSDLDPPS